MRDEAYFSQFNDKVDEAFNKAVEEAEKDNGNKTYEELPDGKYEVAVTDLVMNKSKKGDWKLQATFKVIAGQYEKRLVWAHYVLKPNLVGIANKFLSSLESGCEIKYDTELQYAKLIDDVLTNIKGYKEYALEIKTNDKGFRNYKIYKVFEVKPEELPFS